jgi:cyclomaltodextrinase / maltogenic alpha-amylase / neopullulanase
MNYGIARAALGFFAGETLARRYRPGGFRLRPLAARTFGEELGRMARLYEWPIIQVQLNLLESHDTARFIYQAAGDWSALRLATLFILTMPGAPCLYYGTEVGLEGGPDPDSRRAFPWDPAQWDQDLLAWTRRAVALRNAHPALRRGGYRQLYAHRGVFAFAREGGPEVEGRGAESALVIFNNLREPRQISLNVRGALASGPATDLWGGEVHNVVDGTLSLNLAPRSAAVFASWSGR